MGFNVAPTYANIYMAVLEERAVYAHDLFHLVRCWYRYIDDVFMIWYGTEDQLLVFFEALNMADLDIWFTVIHSPKELKFLDTLVYKARTHLETDILLNKLTESTF